MYSESLGTGGSFTRQDRETFSDSDHFTCTSRLSSSSISVSFIIVSGSKASPSNMIVTCVSAGSLCSLLNARAMRSKFELCADESIRSQASSSPKGSHVPV